MGKVNMIGGENHENKQDNTNKRRLNHLLCSGQLLVRRLARMPNVRLMPMNYETSEAIKGLLTTCLPAVALIIICAQAILGLVLLPVPVNWMWYLGTILGTGLFTYWKTRDRLPKGTTLNEVVWLPKSELDERLSELLRAKGERIRV